MMQNTYLNLKGIMFNGNILDICNKGNSIINEIVSEQNENIEKNMLNLEDFQKLMKYMMYAFSFLQ